MPLPQNKLLDLFDWNRVEIEDVLANSYKDFHCKGLDYICLQREKYLTVKAYFFEDRITELPEVVCPHDHRYSFTTMCVTGQVWNHWYHDPDKVKGHRTFQRYEWRTPLLGGDGFTHVGEVELARDRGALYEPGGSYRMLPAEFHTIQIAAPETCLVIFQYMDEVLPEVPTTTFCKGDPPEINDLYNRFSADQALKRINWLREKYNG